MRHQSPERTTPHHPKSLRWEANGTTPSSTVKGAAELANVRGDDMAWEGQLVAGRYRLLRTLGSGGMGRVWLATDEVLQRQVAIKECAPPAGLSAVERDLVRGLLLGEARAFARVDHPNVIHTLDVLASEDEPWIVMEYVPSRPLLQVIQESGPLPPYRVAAIGRAVLDGLTAASRAGVLHLDVKPANVLIGDDGRVVLADFGPAVTDEGVGALAGAGIVLGSPKYVAPERLFRGTSTAQADLWSLGATLYHAVEGRPPYVRETIEATLRALADSPPDPPLRAGPLAGVLHGLLQRDPADRLTPAEVADRLQEVARAPEPVRARPRLRRRVAVFATAVAVIAASAAVAAGARQDDHPQAWVAPSPVVRTPLVLPSGFAWWSDAGGFRVAVPAGWRRSRGAGGTLVCTAPAGRPTLRIARWVAPPRNIVAALIDQERDVRLPSYRRIRIEAPDPPDAVWEYTFQDPRAGPTRILRHVVTFGGHTYVIEWRAPRQAWAADLQTLAEVLDSFGPAPGE
jgi:eukaryotic-like serine/threonine-protein kinase